MYNWIAQVITRCCIVISIICLTKIKENGNFSFFFLRHAARKYSTYYIQLFIDAIIYTKYKSLWKIYHMTEDSLSMVSNQMGKSVILCTHSFTRIMVICKWWIEERSIIGKQFCYVLPCATLRLHITWNNHIWCLAKIQINLRGQLQSCAILFAYDKLFTY